MPRFLLPLLLVCLLFPLPTAAAEPEMEPQGKLSPAMRGLLDHDAGPYRIWIFFADKGLADRAARDSAIAVVEAAYNPRAVERRRLRGKRSMDGGPLFDSRDLPVYEPYVDQVSDTGARVRIRSRWVNAVSAEASRAQIGAIAALPAVTKVQPVARSKRPEILDERPAGAVRAAPGSKTVDYGRSNDQLAQMNLIALHDEGYTGEGVLVGILDTGFRRDHDAFNQPGFEVEVIAEYDFVDGDTDASNEVGDPSSQHNHGTYILGTLGSYYPGELVGGAYGATFALAKTEDTTDEYPAEEDNFVAGLEFLEAQGVDMTTSSLGYIDWYTQTDLDGETAVTTIAVNTASDLGVHTVNAAGNEYHDSDPATSSLIAPSDAFSVITCGAVTSSGTISSFSSDGPTADGRVKPELLARGSSTSTVSPGSTTTFTSVDGTSLSTPLVAGAVACLIQAHPGWTVEDMREALFTFADYDSDGLGFDPEYVRGYGIVNAMSTHLNYYTPAGIVDLQDDFYACNDTLEIALRDDNIPGGPPTITIELQSTTESLPEIVTLTQVAPESGRYAGTFLTTSDPALNGDGAISVNHDGTLTAEYIDADDGEGGINVLVTDTATVDCVPPLINNVQTTDIQPRSATVTIDTNEPTIGTVHYGTACGALTGSAFGSGFSTSAAVTLSGLYENSVYFYAVEAADEAGNGAADDNGGQCYTFSTPDIPDFFTELFVSDNDLANHRLTFQPNGSVDFYGGCQDPIIAFPTDPTGGTAVTLTDDGNALVTLTGATVSLYGVSYDSFYIGANGYITFTASDGDYSETLEDHFDLPRISALFDDLNPSSAGTVSWKQLADRTVVTWEDVPEYSTGNNNNFQIEMYFNGLITINYLEVGIPDGLAGLSDGSGLSPDFYESDLSNMLSCGGAPCLDGVLGEGEERIDCGGPCPPCDCLSDGECDDALYCTGTESCNEYGVCVATGDPCAGSGQQCKEWNHTCVDCLTDSHCDDDLFCNGDEICRYDNSCMAGPAPCPWTTCNDTSDVCIICDNDGSCEPGEDCNNCPNDCITGTNTECGNTICETGDGENCITCPDDCNGQQHGLLQDQYCCGDGSTGNNPVTCTDVRCSAEGNSCSWISIIAYCCGDGTCEDIETSSNCPADCTPAVPGEAGAGAQLLVDGFDRASGLMSISFGVPCAAVDHTIQYGELIQANLESYSWSGQECDLGAAGVYDWPTAGTPDALFFVVVADNGLEEGSYGQSSYGFERAEDAAGATCQYDQNLQYSCE